MEIYANDDKWGGAVMIERMPDITPWDGSGPCPLEPSVEHVVILRRFGCRVSTDKVNYRRGKWGWSNDTLDYYDIVGYVLLADIPRWAKSVEKTAYLYHSNGHFCNLCDCGATQIFQLIYDREFPWGGSPPMTSTDFYARFGGESSEFNGRTNGIIRLYR